MEPARDTEAILDVWQRSAGAVYDFMTDEFVEAEKQRMVDAWLPASETIVFDVEGSVVGFLSLLDDEIGALFVDPDHQGAGVGAELLGAARLIRASLVLNVVSSNDRAIRFYERHGFEQVSTSVNEVTGQLETRMQESKKRTTRS